MKAIRGATTVSCDSAEEIKEKVNELLFEITRQNCLQEQDIICIMFSNTTDLHAFYPAKAARECGFVNCALFSSLEPEIDGALKMCIRVMLLIEKDILPKHIYLNEAINLRKDISQLLNIAIDGPAGSGKSTVARAIAKKLNILCLDTGAMYRACALKCVNCGVSVTDENKVAKIIENINLSVQYKDGSQVTLLDGKDVSEDIRKPEISMLASTVSAINCVRTKMVELQREIANKNSCILDGRDIGTNVLPNATFKFYLTASCDERAKRRYREYIQKGKTVDFDEIKRDIEKRDVQDTNRKIAPLKQAHDAIYIDTSDMEINEVIDFIIKKIQETI